MKCPVCENEFRLNSGVICISCGNRLCGDCHFSLRLLDPLYKCSFCRNSNKNLILIGKSRPSIEELISRVEEVTSPELIEEAAQDLANHTEQTEQTEQTERKITLLVKLSNRATTIKSVELLLSSLYQLIYTSSNHLVDNPPSEILGVLNKLAITAKAPQNSKLATKIFYKLSETTSFYRYMELESIMSLLAFVSQDDLEEALVVLYRSIEKENPEAHWRRESLSKPENLHALVELGQRAIKGGDRFIVAMSFIFQKLASGGKDSNVLDIDARRDRLVNSATVDLFLSMLSNISTFNYIGKIIYLFSLLSLTPDNSNNDQRLDKLSTPKAIKGFTDLANRVSNYYPSGAWTDTGLEYISLYLTRTLANLACGSSESANARRDRLSSQEVIDSLTKMAKRETGQGLVINISGFFSHLIVDGDLGVTARRESLSQLENVELLDKLAARANTPESVTAIFEAFVSLAEGRDLGVIARWNRLFRSNTLNRLTELATYATDTESIESVAFLFYLLSNETRALYLLDDVDRILTALKGLTSRYNTPNSYSYLNRAIDNISNRPYKTTYLPFRVNPSIPVQSRSYSSHLGSNMGHYRSSQPKVIYR